MRIERDCSVSGNSNQFWEPSTQSFGCAKWEFGEGVIAKTSLSVF